MKGAPVKHNRPATKSGIPGALSLVFSRSHYLLWALFVAAIFFFFSFYFPIIATPGNTLAIMLQSTPWWGIAFLALLSLALGALALMQAYAFRHTHARVRKEVAGGVAGFISSILSSLFATASCSLCVAALFSFLGASTILLLLAYRWHIAFAGLALVLVSLHFTAQKINGDCVDCSLSNG